MLEQKTTTNEEFEALCAALLPKFNEYLMRHSKNIFSCELATSLDGIKTMPALYDLDGVQKQVIAPLSLLTKDVDIEIEESKKATAAANAAAGKANEAAASVTKATTDLTTERKKVEDAVAASKTATDAANKATDNANAATTKANTATANADKATAAANAATTKANTATANADKATAAANDATAKTNMATAKANDAAASVTKATTDLTAERKKVEDAVNSSATQTAAAKKATYDTLTSKAAIEQNESARQAAEKTRQTQETTRQTQESARVEAEKQRVSAENGRATAESGRVKAETKRETDTKAAIASSKTQTDLAKEMNDHPPKMGSNGNWWQWDLSKHEYVDTGVIARGGAMYPSFRQHRNKLLMIDYGSNVAEHVVKRRNKLVIKV